MCCYIKKKCGSVSQPKRRWYEVDGNVLETIHSLKTMLNRLRKVIQIAAGVYLRIA